MREMRGKHMALQEVIIHDKSNDPESMTNIQQKHLSLVIAIVFPLPQLSHRGVLSCCRLFDQLTEVLNNRRLLGEGFSH